jgi:energy-coupling factor transport system ATP-binding protein
LIDIEDLSFRYADSKKASLSDVSLSINDSEFVLIAGPSGCGKSTLCRCINGLIPWFYGGEITGSVKVQDRDVFTTPTKEMAKVVGTVFQDPENQLVANSVEREIAFGMENMGFPRKLMAKRIEEVMDMIGIDHLRHRQISTLSGGEKQKIAIASVLVLHPQVLILDEPTSELDPKGAEEVIQITRRLNEELGLTILLVEHRLDRVLQMVDRLIIMNEGGVKYDGDPRRWTELDLPDIGMPPITRLGKRLGKKEIPLSVKEGRSFLSSFLKKANLTSKSWSYERSSKCIARVTNLRFAYPEGKEVLKEINLSIYEGEFIAVIGRNASGKTTLAQLLNGLLKPTGGKVIINGLDTKKTSVEDLARFVGYVFQDPNLLLFAETVEEEITFMMKNLGFSKDLIKRRLEEELERFNLRHCRLSYPRSLSTGEKQRVALASVLAAKPKMLILDEPTRGLDYLLKRDLMKYLLRYKKEGGTILLITHDIELVAEFAERVILMSEGRIVADGEKHSILANSLHFSPQINRLIQPFSLPQDILTVEELLECLQ